MVCASAGGSSCSSSVSRVRMTRWGTNAVTCANGAQRTRGTVLAKDRLAAAVVHAASAVGGQRAQGFRAPDAGVPVRGDDHAATAGRTSSISIPAAPTRRRFTESRHTPQTAQSRCSVGNGRKRSASGRREVRVRGRPRTPRGRGASTPWSPAAYQREVVEAPVDGVHDEARRRAGRAGGHNALGPARGGRRHVRDARRPNIPSSRST